MVHLTHRFRVRGGFICISGTPVPGSTEGNEGIMSSGAHRRAGRPSLVLLQLLVFVFYIFGPTGTLAE